MEISGRISLILPPEYDKHGQKIQKLILQDLFSLGKTSSISQLGEKIIVTYPFSILPNLILYQPITFKGIFIPKEKGFLSILDLSTCDPTLDQLFIRYNGKVFLI